MNSISVDIIVNALIREHLGRTGQTDVLKEFDINIPRTEDDVTSTKILADKMNITNFYREKRKSRKKDDPKVSILETIVEKILNSRRSKQPSRTSKKKPSQVLRSAPPKSLASAGFDVIVNSQNYNNNNNNNNNNSIDSSNNTSNIKPQRGGCWGSETTASVPNSTRSTTAPEEDQMEEMEEIDLDNVDFDL